METTVSSYSLLLNTYISYTEVNYGRSGTMDWIELVVYLYALDAMRTPERTR